MDSIKVLASKHSRFSEITTEPIQDVSMEQIQIRCEADAVDIFHWLGVSIPTCTYNKLRQLIYDELLEDSE